MIKKRRKIYSIVIFSIMLVLTQPAFADVTTPPETYSNEAILRAIPMTILVVFLSFLLIRLIKFFLKKKER